MKKRVRMSSRLSFGFLQPFVCVVILGLAGCGQEAPNERAETAAEPQPVEWLHLSSTKGDLPIPNGGTQQTASLVVDIDGDGINDIVIAERTQAPSVVWLRRTSDGWQKYVVDDTPLRIEAGGAFHDITGSGYPDLIFGGDSRSDEVWWWENPGPDYDANTPWTRRVIKADGGNKHHDQVIGDFTGDGRMELVFWNQRAQVLCITPVPEDPRNTSPWPYSVIYAWDEGTEHEGLAKADIDGDGIEDVIGGGRWFKYRGGDRFDAIVIDDEQRFTRAAAGHFEPGGSPQVLFVPGDATGPITYYKASGDPSDPTSWSGRSLIARDIVHGHSLAVGDVNADGHLDIFLAEMHTPGHGENAEAMILYGNGRGDFRVSVVSAGIGNHESKLADLNGNGRLDILTKPYTWEAPRVDVWLNQGEGPPP